MQAKKLLILGVCGTFMAGIAQIAKQLNFTVIGCDENIYPPMSEVLQQAGINCKIGYDEKHLTCQPDVVIVGNAIKRGNPLLEAILNQKIPFISGPQWLYETVLRNKQVLAVSGTHGKTTTSSLLAHILAENNLQPGFLIGGMPKGFNQSARITTSPYFVIEADEYDTAFFDKRSKFLHYHPDTLIINNIEFDHADIFSDLSAIIWQFQQLIRTMAQKATIIYPNDEMMQTVFANGCWSQQWCFGENDDWRYQLRQADGSEFVLQHRDEQIIVKWPLIGEYNVVNALAACMAASTVGISLSQCQLALESFTGVKRRLECIADLNNIKIYEDFAHHPTAIAKTCQALKARLTQGKLHVILEFRSHTMRLGKHQADFAAALQAADELYVKRPDPDFGVAQLFQKRNSMQTLIADNTCEIIKAVCDKAKAEDLIVIMSNGGFDNIYQLLPKQLQQKKSLQA